MKVPPDAPARPRWLRLRYVAAGTLAFAALVSCQMLAGLDERRAASGAAAGQAGTAGGEGSVGEGGASGDAARTGGRSGSGGQTSGGSTRGLEDGRGGVTNEPNPGGRKGIGGTEPDGIAQGGTGTPGAAAAGAGAGGNATAGSEIGGLDVGGTSVSAGAAGAGETAGVGGEGTGGVTGSGGPAGTGGAGGNAGGNPTGGTGGAGAEGGAHAGTGGAESGGAGTGGTTAAGGSTGTGDNCTIGAWAEADPSVAGPFTVKTEEEVGPEAGEAEDDIIPRFTLFRPEDMNQSGLCHPLITWGNGTGSTPSMYGSLLRHFASHGLVVIASNSKNVASGNPRPMLVGVTWVLEQNDDPSSVLYHHIDTTRIGATGHSQGAMATSQACGDEHITTCVPIEGAQVQSNLHGPAMFFCGGQDDLVGCDSAQSAFDAVTVLPAMFAEYLSVDHGSWLSFGNTRSDVETAITAWMRVHLMGDESLRSWFYGASCQLCTDSAWQIDRKNMDP